MVTIKNNAFKMKYKYIKPTPAISKYVNFYWIYESAAGNSGHRVKVIPDGSMQMIFHYCERTTQIKANMEKYLQPHGMICGKNTVFSEVVAGGATGLIAVYFKPFGARDFFNLPMNEITGQSLAPEKLLGKEGRLLEEKILNASSDENRINFIEKFLKKRFYIKNTYDFDIVEECVNRIRNNKALNAVNGVAKDLYLSGRQLERKFSSIVGLTPKMFIRVSRLNRCIDLSSSQKNKNLTELAYASRYYDQSHFINDFKSLTGLTPKNYFLLQDENS